MPTIAETVVCDLTKTGKGVLTVDGEEFPWWVSEEGATVRKLNDDLYLVHLTILAIAKGDAFHAGGLGDAGNIQPVIDGIEFPWYISDEGATFRHRGCSIPTVELEFFTRSVTGIKADATVFRDFAGNTIAKVPA